MGVLVLADAWDPHADKVCEIIAKQGVSYFRFDLDVDSLRRTSFSLCGEDFIIRKDGEVFDGSMFNSIWARRLNVTLSLQQEHGESDAGFQIWRNEWNRHLYWIFDALRDRYWLNGLLEGGLADNKHYQMRVAKTVGLLVPPTLSTNSVDDIRSFICKNGDVALKFISQKTVYKSGDFFGIYVNRLNLSDFDSFGDCREQPVVIQRYIEKSFEVRYTYVCGEHFVCKIESQKSKRANVDWRRYDLANTPHVSMEPPAHIRGQINLFMERLQVDYGALDFVVDRDGTWWFLELNANGQWLWIEELTGLPISTAIAKMLTINGVNRNENVC